MSEGAAWPVDPGTAGDRVPIMELSASHDSSPERVSEKWHQRGEDCLMLVLESIKKKTKKEKEEKEEKEGAVNATFNKTRHETR